MAEPELSQFSDLELIGKGAGADVYRARRTSTGGYVAIKAFSTSLDAATISRRATREVNAMVALKGHPNVIQIEELLEVDGRVYLIMEHASGGSLADRIRAAPSGMDAASVAVTGGQVAAALAAAHARSLLHRDVKPQNILFGDYEIAKLCDFGIAAVLSGEASRTSAISIRYASPEELDGDKLTSATDIYSLGATLLHAVVGRPADLSERLSGVDMLLADTPNPLRDTIIGCLRLEPERRPSAAEIADRLASGTPRPAAPPTAPKQIEPDDGPPRLENPTVSVIHDRQRASAPPPAEAPAKRPPWLLIGGAVLVLLAAVAAFVIFGGDDSAEVAPTTIALPVTTALPSTTVPAPSTTVVTSTTLAPTTTPVPDTTIPANAFGDPVGPLAAGGSLASQLVLDLVNGSETTPVSGRASIYRSWALVNTRFVGWTATVTPDGFQLVHPSGSPTVTLSGFTLADGQVTDIAEAGMPDAVQSIELIGTSVADENGGPSTCQIVAMVRVNGALNTVFIDVPDATGEGIDKLYAVRIDRLPNSNTYAVAYTPPEAGTDAFVIVTLPTVAGPTASCRIPVT